MKRFGTMVLSFLLISDICHAQGGTGAPTRTQPIAGSSAKVVHQPIPTNQPEAEMPAEAQQKRNSGICVISMVVGINGIPQDFEVVRCSDPVFAPNSLAAVAKYRFKPAVDQNNKPVPVKVSIQISFKFFAGGREPEVLIKYVLAAPPGVTSPGPDANGVYPLSKTMDAPAITKLVDDGFGNAAMLFDDGVACDVVLTIDRKGKPSDPQVTHCDKPILATSAVATLLKSRFEPGRISGEAIPVRASIHLVFAGFAPIPK